MPRVLVVEDEAAIAELIAVNLRHSGFSPTLVFDAEAARREVDAQVPDLILLDWMLPGESGASLCRSWRQQERLKKPSKMHGHSYWNRCTTWKSFVRMMQPVM